MKRRKFIKNVGKEGDPAQHDTIAAIEERKKYPKSSNKAYEVAKEYGLDRAYDQIEVYHQHLSGDIGMRTMYDVFFPKGNGGDSVSPNDFKAWLEVHYKEWFKACLDNGLLIDACEDLITSFVCFTDVNKRYFSKHNRAKGNFIRCLDLWNGSFYRLTTA